MRARRPAVLAPCLAVGLLACAASGSGDAPAAGAPLAGTQWRLVALLDDDLATREPGDAPRLAFEPEARAAGSGGCNRFSGRYALDGDRLARFVAADDEP